MIRGMEMAVWAVLLLKTAWTDIRFRKIPNRYCLLLAAAGLLFRSPDLREGFFRLLGGGLFLTLEFTAVRMIGNRGLGAGDLKWIAASAVCLGIDGALRALLIACLGALITVGFWGIGRDSDATFPFGPFLAAGTGWMLLQDFF